MTPLIDCVFTLLIVLMLSATFNSPDSLGLKLPQAATHDIEEKHEIALGVDAAGKFFLNERPVDANNLVNELRPLIDRSENKVVTFRGDEKMDYTAFIKALDAVRAAGGVHMNIMHN